VTLTPGAVASGRFGKLFARQVQGQIYTQPLVLTGVTVAGKGRHDLVVVATQANKVYAFDATNPAQGEPLWLADLGASVRALTPGAGPCRPGSPPPPAAPPCPHPRTPQPALTAAGCWRMPPPHSARPAPPPPPPTPGGGQSGGRRRTGRRRGGERLLQHRQRG